MENPGQVARLARLPAVTRLAPVNRLLLPHELKSDVELRQAAATLRADMLLVYTLDTTFRVQDKLAPLSVVTLSFRPTSRRGGVHRVGRPMDPATSHLRFDRSHRRGISSPRVDSGSAGVDAAGPETGAFASCGGLKRTWRRVSELRRPSQRSFPAGALQR